MSAKDVIVIGAGVAGLTAAKLAAQQGYSVINFESVVFGGLVLNINELDGEPHGSGAEFASTLLMDITDLGVESLNETVTGLARKGNIIEVTTDQGSHQARAVVVASGARLKKLGVPGEAEFQDRGVAHCADCDGPMYQEQSVAVIGGGDAAMQEALVLAQYAKEVQLIHRGGAFSAKAHLVDAVKAKANIKIHWNTTVEQVLGTDAVTGLRVKSNGADAEIACSGMFAYIGLEPNNECLPADVQRAADGCALTDAAMKTSLEGVLAIGAVRSGYGGRLTQAMTEAQTAVATLKQLLG